MKNLGLSTILLGFVTVSILVSVVMMAFNMYKMTSAVAATTVSDYWKNNKLFVIGPTVINVMSMMALGAYFVMG